MNFSFSITKVEKEVGVFTPMLIGRAFPIPETEAFYIPRDSLRHFPDEDILDPRMRFEVWGTPVIGESILSVIKEKSVYYAVDKKDSTNNNLVLRPIS